MSDGDDDVIRLKSGREIYANHGIVGISLTDDTEPLAEGYDGHIWIDNQHHRWTPEERRELADLMIARWKWWVENGVGR